MHVTSRIFLPNISFIIIFHCLLLNYFSYCWIQFIANFTQFHTITQLPFLTIAVYMEIFAPVLFSPFLPSLSFGQILNWINLRLFFNCCVNDKRACIIYFNCLADLKERKTFAIVKRANKVGRKLTCIQFAFWNTYLYPTQLHCNRCIHKNHERLKIKMISLVL